MLKIIAFRIVRYRVKTYLPSINPKFYYKLFTLSYKLFVYLKPSQLFVVILALLNKTEIKNLIGIPSLFVLLNTVLSDNYEPNLETKALEARLEAY